jgi:hypothetical protein
MRLTSQTSAVSGDMVNEARTLSRLIYAISLSSNLQDALMGFYSSLPDRESLVRASLVLALVDEFLPSEVATKLRATSSFSPSEPIPLNSLPANFVGPALIFLSSIVVGLTIVGTFTACGFIASKFHLF